MRKLGTEAYNEVRTWIYRNARPVDLAVWQYHFENGSSEDVVGKLAFYQNKDGGFGNALEPDCWNRESSPVTTMTALGLLRGIGFTDTDHPVMQGIFRFLESDRHCTDEGWLFSIPSNDRCPRAPWWTYDEGSNAVQGTGITAVLCSFIIHFADKESKLFEKASRYVDKLLKNVSQIKDFGEAGVGGIAALAQDIEEKGLSSRFDCSAVKEELKDMINRSIERDPGKWSDYTPRPSEFISSPSSPFYPGNEEIVEKELDYLIETRNPEGVWNINWTWFQLGGQYAKEFAVSENWWMSVKAIEKMSFLRSFDRI